MQTAAVKKKRFRGLLGLRQIAFKLSDISLPILTDKTRLNAKFGRL